MLCQRAFDCLLSYFCACWTVDVELKSEQALIYMVMCVVYIL